MKKLSKGLGIGCMVILGGLIFLTIIGFLVDSEDDTYSPSETKYTNSDTEKFDSLEVKEDFKNDSIRLAQKEEALRLLKSFKKNSDEFNDTEFYKDKRTPYYSNVNFIYPYLGKKGDMVWLRLRFQYTNDDWLFINRALIKTDNETYTIVGNWERDNDTEIWEWLDMQVEINEYLMLKDIANSKSVKIRYEGSQYHDDRTITSKEKDIIKKTLEVYDKLK